MNRTTLRATTIPTTVLVPFVKYAMTSDIEDVHDFLELFDVAFIVHQQRNLGIMIGSEADISTVLDLIRFEDASALLVAGRSAEA